MTIKSNASLTILSFCLLLSVPAIATTWDEIAMLDANKTQRPGPSIKTPAQHEKSPRWLALSNGERINLNNWKVVVFLSSTCRYCHEYNPVVKQMADIAGFGLQGYSLDGKGDDTFPYPLTPSPEVLARFFGTDIPVATPTTFLVNVNTLTTFPLLQGNQMNLMARLDEVFQMAWRGGLR